MRSRLFWLQAGPWPLILLWHSKVIMCFACIRYNYLIFAFVSCWEQVSVRILGGLMTLGYEIGTIMKRTSCVMTKGDFTIKIDDIDGLGNYIQIQGKDRHSVAELGTRLGLDGTYIPRSYIEQVTAPTMQ